MILTNMPDGILAARHATNPRSFEAIAARLIRTREALGLHQAEFCRRAEIASNTYNQWEKALGRPSLDQALKLVDRFGLTLDWIYLGAAGALPADLAGRIAASTCSRVASKTRKARNG
jgi:transcriptional regulator with XRE-family HTH domain